MRLGNLQIEPPVILAPMAGVTNRAFRQLCREFGAPLTVCEMVTSRGITERIPKTFEFMSFAPAEIRSVQLYGVDPHILGEATRIVCGELGVQHVDLNFGCPVPKVTRRGGGGVLPWKRDRLKAILSAVVAAASPFEVPVTMKTRLGIDDDHLTYRESGKIAQDAGVTAVVLHARTVLQAYSGFADWTAIATLVNDLDIPVIGNGDLWEAADALRMIEQTKCAGVEIGRGALGRPWLFRDLANAFADEAQLYLPDLGQVKQLVHRHGELLAELFGERHGLTDLRKHMGWYFKGFPVGGDLRHALAMVSSLHELETLLAQIPDDVVFPINELGIPRGRQGSPKAKVTLPHGWLDSRNLGDTNISAAETA
ncbi:MAG: tRNA dihydrouridine synthase DusB [Propionibacteriaceae bacterium]|nr:tRNA dihydrouridine synthase DusB [Propionibacteriaceae bacterium]